jgi:hypothetical protein
MTNRDERHFNEEFSHFMYNAYIRDGESVHTNEALLLACLLHTKGKGRAGRDLHDVQKIMRDRNLENK